MHFLLDPSLAHILPLNIPVTLNVQYCRHNRLGLEHREPRKINRKGDKQYCQYLSGPSTWCTVPPSGFVSFAPRLPPPEGISSQSLMSAVRTHFSSFRYARLLTCVAYIRPCTATPQTMFSSDEIEVTSKGGGAVPLFSLSTHAATRVRKFLEEQFPGSQGPVS